MISVLLYLASVVVANLAVSKFGPPAVIPVSFLLIGFDLTLRDRLHDSWNHKNLWSKMALLIGSGSVLSVLINWDSALVALASFLAFVSSGLVDTVVYQLLTGHSKAIRVNVSNIFSAAVDSMVFLGVALGPILGLGSILYSLILAQIITKILGGFIWSIILYRKSLTAR